MFKNLNIHINAQIVKFLTHIHIPKENTSIQPAKKALDLSQTQLIKSEITTDEEGKQVLANSVEQSNAAPKPTPIIAEPKIGRNDPCFCGSGKKFKNCHGN